MSVVSCSCRWKRQVNCRSPRTFLERRSVLLNIWSRRGRLLQHDPPGETPEILICQIDLKTTCVHFFRNFLAVVVELEVSDAGAQTQTADPAFKPLLDLQIFQKLGSRWTRFMNLLYNFCSFVVVVLFLFFRFFVFFTFLKSPVVWEKNDLKTPEIFCRLRNFSWLSIFIYRLRRVFICVQTFPLRTNSLCIHTQLCTYSLIIGLIYNQGFSFYVGTFAMKMFSLFSQD